jgi:hypothetical protein
METGFSTTSLTTPLSNSANILATSNSLSNSSSSLLDTSLFGKSSSNIGNTPINGNIIVGNGASVIPGDNPQLFTTQVRNALDNFVSIVFDRLNNKFVSEGGDTKTYTVPNENPFANGNNPFGEGNMPELPARDFLVSQFGENYPMPSEDASNFLQENFPNGVNYMPFGGSPFSDGSGTVTDGNNSFGSNGNAPVDGSNNPPTGVNDLYLVGDSPTVDSGENLIAAVNNDDLTTSVNKSNTVHGDASPSSEGGNLFSDGSIRSESTSGDVISNSGDSSSSDVISNSGDSSSGNDNPFTNSFAGGNPFAQGFGGANLSGGSSDSTTGTSNSNPFAGASLTETLSGTLDFVIDLRESFRSMGSNSVFGGNAGNQSPLNSPSELLRLFRSDMTGFGLTVESFTNFVGENNPFAGTSNPFAGTNPFAEGENDSTIQQLDNRLFKFLAWALDGLLPVTGTPNVFQTPEGELPLGYGNRDFGSGNAVVGNANRDYGTNNGSIGNNNWNWDSATNNATIGNGNWNFSSDNKTVGNGNWNLDYASDNKTFGNGNWNIGSDNSTLGNGNYNFGNNNLVIGNGNWVFTSNTIVIGNGNWSVVLDNTPANQATVSTLLERVNNIALGAEIKNVVDDLVDTAIRKMGNTFYGVTEGFNQAQKDTFDKVIREQDTLSLKNPFASLANT